MKKILYTTVSIFAFTQSALSGEFGLDDKFNPDQYMSLAELAKRTTPVKEIGSHNREKKDDAPQQIPNAGIYVKIMEDIGEVRSALSASDTFLLKKEHSKHERDVSDVVYDALITYRPINLKRDKRLEKLLSSWFVAEKKEISNYLTNGTWQDDKKLGQFSVTYNSDGYPSVSFKYANKTLSNIVLPIYSDRRGLDRDLYLKKGISFNKLSKEDQGFLNLINDFFFKKIQYKKGFKETLGDYLNGASNPTKRVPLNAGLRPEELFIRDALLTATFRDEVLKRARLSHLTKERIPENVISYWASQRGKVLPFFGGQYLYGSNMFGDISLIIPSNKAALPLLKSARENNPGCFLPFGHKMSDINVETGFFWLQRNKDRVEQISNALIGVQNEDYNPLKKALRELALNISDDVHIDLKNQNTKLALEGLNYLLVNSFIYNNDFLSFCEKNRNVNKPFYDAVISFIKDYRNITFNVLEPIVPLTGGIISRDRVPPSFQDKFEKQQSFRGRNAEGKPTQLPRKAMRNHYGDLSLEQLHKKTGLTFPFYQEDIGKSLSLIPKGTLLGDGHRVQGESLINGLLGMYMTKKEIQDVLFTALDIPHTYSREFIEPMGDNKNAGRFQTIGYAMDNLKKSEELDKVMGMFGHLPEKDKLLEIFNNAKV